MIKATIQNSPYCTEICFPCSEAELSKKLGEIGMNPEALHKILCKSRSDLAKGGLQSKHDWDFLLIAWFPWAGTVCAPQT